MNQNYVESEELWDVIAGFQWVLNAVWQHDDTVFFAFPDSYRDLPVAEVKVFDSDVD